MTIPLCRSGNEIGSPNKPFNPIARKTRSGLTAALGLEMLTMLQLAERTVAATLDDPEGSSLSVRHVLESIEFAGSKNSHLRNPLNDPVVGCIKRREIPLTGSELVYGELLTVSYVNHDSVVILHEYETKQSLENALASLSGIVNPFTTYCVAFIRERVESYRIAYRDVDGAAQWFDKHVQHTVGRHAAERATERWVVWNDSEAQQTAARDRAKRGA